MWKRIDRKIIMMEDDRAIFEIEYGTENEGIRAAIILPKPMQNSEFAIVINNKIKKLNELVFANQPEKLDTPITQGFALQLISPPESNPNSESRAILTAHPINLLETMEQVCEILGIPLTDDNRAELNAISDPYVKQLQNRARALLLFSTPASLRPNKYSLMPENNSQLAFYGMGLNDKLPEAFSQIPEDLTFNNFSYKDSKKVVSNSFSNLAKQDGITLVSAMPVANSPICSGEHFPYLIENIHLLKDLGVSKFAILVPDIMDSAYLWARDLMLKASWVKDNPQFYNSPTLVEDHFIIISDSSRKIGNFLGIMEPHPRGVYVPHRSSFVLGNGLVLGSLKHENPVFCTRDQDANKQAAPKALLELIEKGYKDHQRLLSTAPRAVIRM